MFRNTQHTCAPLNQIQELTSKGMASLIDRTSALLRPNNTDLQTIFTGKSKKQIVNLINLDDDGGSSRSWGDLHRNLIVLLTDLFFFYERCDEVVITPSLYIQYLDFKTLEELVDTKTSSKEFQGILLKLRGFMYDMTRKAVEQSSESDTMTASEVFFLISFPIIGRLKYLEARRVPNNIPNRLSVQKRRNLRIENADYSYARIRNENAPHLGDDGLEMVYKHLKKSTFVGAAGSLDTQHTVFEDCILDKANFHYSRFDWTTFIGTSIDKTTFTNSKFFDVDFKGFNNSESAVFVNCRFCLCKMAGCKALFIDCDFDDCENDGLRIINNNNEQTNEQEGFTAMKSTKQQTNEQEATTKMLKQRTWLDDVEAVFASESASVIIELLSGHLEANTKDDMWKGRAMGYIAAITRPLVYLRDKGYIQLSPAIYSKYMELSEAEQLAFKHDGKYGAEFNEVLRPLLAYIESVPGYDTALVDEGQSKKTNEQFGHITMQIVKILNHLRSPKEQTAEQEGFTAMKDTKQQTDEQKGFTDMQTAKNKPAPTNEQTGFSDMQAIKSDDSL